MVIPLNQFFIKNIEGATILEHCLKIIVVICDSHTNFVISIDYGLNL